MRRSERPVRMRLWDILNSADIAGSTIANITLAEFANDPIRRFAAERGVEVISEASRHLPDVMKGEGRPSAVATDRRHRQRSAARL